MKIGDLVRWIYITDEDKALLAQGKTPMAYGHIGIVTHTEPEQFVIFWAIDNESSGYMTDDESLSECMEVL